MIWIIQKTQANLSAKDLLLVLNFYLENEIGLNKLLVLLTTLQTHLILIIFLILDGALLPAKNNT